MSDDGRFDGSPVSRRQFFKLSAAAGAAVTLPGNATSSVESEAFTAEYQYLLNHTPKDYRAPTLITFSGPAGLQAFESMGVGQEVRTTTTPQNAAYAKLTTAEANQASDLPEAQSFQFSPGSNPFWRIGYYPAGVFPEPRRSVDYIGFEQLKDGLAELEDRYPDRVNVKNVGRSPGHYNNVTAREDPKGMYVVELTNFDSETDFEDKEKVFHSCSLHGPERAGAETAARVVENVARGSEPDIEGAAPGTEAEVNPPKLEPLLDEVVVLLGFTNPDGWVARNPQYDSGWQFTGPGTSLVVDEPPRIPAGPLYERGNAEVYDTNRQYPVVGMINPSYYPAQPNDPKSEEEKTPSFVHEKVPDAKAFVDFFSDYENLNYGSDLHGGPIFNEFVLGLISQDQFDTRQLHELYEMCLVIDDVLESALQKWTTAGDIRTTLLGDETYDPALYGVLPTEAFDYSTIYDTINYTVTGAFLDWMAHPEPIGLDLTTLDFEMSFSWAVNGNIWNPELVEMEVKGYRTAIRTITAFAVRNSDTPGTVDQFDAYTESDGESVAYVTTGAVGTQEDALMATSDDLVFDDGAGDDTTTNEGIARNTEQVTLSETTTELTFDVAESDLHSMGFHLHGSKVIADLEVVNPSGEVVGSYEGVTEERAGGKCCGLPEFTTTDPEPGTWTLRVDNYRDLEQHAEFMYWTLAASGSNPDPRTAWPGGEGFEQRDYLATPFRFFEDYAEYIDDDSEMVPVTVEEVADGALMDGEEPAYDHVVVIHDYGANADAGYIGETSGYLPADHPEEGNDVDGYTEALDEYVNADGNLVLTDAGVNLLTEFSNELVDGGAISREDIVVPEFIVPRFSGAGKNLGHPLFGTDGDVRPIQNQFWKVQPLGYTAGTSDGAGQAPMFLPDEGALAAAGEEATTTVAGRAEHGSTGETGIAAASLTPDDSTGTGVHVISSLLPPASQQNLHPFGLQNYTVTFLGYVLFTSALGWEQVRETGDEVRRYGIGDQWDTSDVEHIEPGGTELSASGSRDVGSSVVSGREVTRVEVTVSNVSHEARVYDQIPDGWTLLEAFSDAATVEGESGTVRLFHRESKTEEPDETDTVAADAQDVTFTYFVESPEGVDQSGPATFGPGEAEAVPIDSTATYAGETNALVFGADL